MELLKGMKSGEIIVSYKHANSLSLQVSIL